MTTTDEATFEGSIIKCPMSAAAVFGRKDVCEWLFHHGAHSDINRERSNPLRLSLEPTKPPGQNMKTFTDACTDTVKWLLFNGGIPSDAEGYLNASAMKKMFSMDRIEQFSVENAISGRERLLNWAESICSVHDAYCTFLGGTIHVPRLDLAEGPGNRPVRGLSGYKGIRKKIAEYVGVMTGRKLRTVRCIVEPLKKALDDGPSDDPYGLRRLLNRED